MQHICTYIAIYETHQTYFNMCNNFQSCTNNDKNPDREHMSPKKEMCSLEERFDTFVEFMAMQLQLKEKLINLLSQTISEMRRKFVELEKVGSLYSYLSSYTSC